MLEPPDGPAQLAKALEAARECFKSALCAAQTPACAHCRVAVPVEVKPAKTEVDALPQHTASTGDGVGLHADVVDSLEPVAE